MSFILDEVEPEELHTAPMVMGPERPVGEVALSQELEDFIARQGSEEVRQHLRVPGAVGSYTLKVVVYSD